MWMSTIRSWCKFSKDIFKWRWVIWQHKTFRLTNFNNTIIICLKYVGVTKFNSKNSYLKSSQGRRAVAKFLFKEEAGTVVIYIYNFSVEFLNW